MSSFLLNMPNTVEDDRETIVQNEGVQTTTRGPFSPRKGKDRAEEWVSSQAGYSVGAKAGTSTVETSGERNKVPGDTLVKETAKAWIDPKALARLIREQASGGAENPQTRSGEEELMIPGPALVEASQFVDDALKQVTEEMKEVHANAKAHGGKIVPAIRKGFQKKAHKGGLVDVPTLPFPSGSSLVTPGLEGNGEGGEGSGVDGEQDDDYQSSVVESIRKDFSDFKEATQSFFWKIDKSLKQIDARLKALEGLPTPVKELGEVVSHRRVLSSGLSPHPVAVYTPASGATSSAPVNVDTSFLLRTRHTLSPAVQHSILVKNIGVQLADSLKLPILKPDWTPEGLSELIAGIEV